MNLARQGTSFLERRPPANRAGPKFFGLQWLEFGMTQTVSGKRTHKLKALGDVASVIRDAGSIRAAATRLGVDVSTVHRWIAAGKAPALRSRRPPRVPRVDAGRSRAERSPEAWARWVRRKFELDDTELQLLGMTVRAMRLERDPLVPVAVRLAASGRVQRLLEQLNLPKEMTEDGETSTTASVRAWPRPA
jgi:excisionase family DNA binding protein